MIKEFFGFGEHQEKATYGLGYKSTLAMTSNAAVLNKAQAIAIAEIVIGNIDWYVPHYSPSILHQAIIYKQILKNTPKELQYVERSLFMINVKN